MTDGIIEPCVGTLDASCAEVCPVECNHPAPERVHRLQRLPGGVPGRCTAPRGRRAHPWERFTAMDEAYYTPGSRRPSACWPTTSNAEARRVRVSGPQSTPTRCAASAEGLRARRRRQSRSCGSPATVVTPRGRSQHEDPGPAGALAVFGVRLGLMTASVIAVAALIGA